MGNIVGEGFNSAIHKQVNIRQLLQGSGYLEGELRTNEELVVLNNNTAWVKLMSSVSVNSPIEINNPTINGFNEPGDVIAKAFVLFNGTSKYEKANGGSTIQREGIDFTNTLGGYNNVYGIGGSADFGLNPMMGITGIDVKHKNRGSIRTATVTVKAFNRTQFEIIDVLYMRLGFSVLLEWGNSIYMDNNGDYVKDGGNLNSLIDPWFKDSNYNSFLTKIRNQSFASNGNYDAMLAKVSNYHWSFKKDGSYNITIDLVSMGDVIESLNAGVSPNSVLSNSAAVIQGNGSLLFNKLQLAASQNKWGEEFYSKFTELSTGLIANSRSVSSYEKIKGIKQIQYHYVQPFGEQKDYLFVKLGKILQILENKIVLKDDNNNTRMLNFDYNYKSNLVKIIKGNTLDSDEFPNNIVINQMSYNPFKCVTLKDIEMKSVNTIVSFNNQKFHSSLENTYNNNLFPTYYAPLNLYILKSETTENFDHGDGYGRIMNILVNVEFVLDVVEDKTDKETGELPLINFLKGILAGINESLGGITELDVWIDETINTVKIIDKNSSGERSSDPTTFDLYGYNSENNTSNFIHDFELKTEITPALSTMITVAATANKTVVGADNTALSKINKGLTDRYKSNLSSNQTQPSTIQLYPGRTDQAYDTQFQAWEKKNNTNTFLTNNIFPEEDPIGIILIANNLDPKDPAARVKAAQDLFEGNENALNNEYKITETRTSKSKFSQNYGFGPSSQNHLKRSNAVVTFSKDVTVRRTLEPGITALPHNYKAPTAAQTYLSAAYNMDQSNLIGEKSFWYSLYNMLIGIWTDDEIKTMESRFKGINDKWNAWKHPNNPNDSFKSGFIPFNLSLTMDGLGGMKIYQKFSVNTDFMPSNYPENIEFLIKNIQHTVKDNKWITKLESFCVSKPDKNAKLTSTPTVTAAGLGGGAITGTNTKSSNFGGLRGDLFSWVKGPNFPDPSDPNNYNGTIYNKPAFNETERQKLLTFQTNGYITAILRASETKIIARPQDFISKPQFPLIEHSRILNCTNGPKTGYYYNTIKFTDAEQLKMFTEILTGIGATDSKYNLLWMKVWRDAEGAVATYNPWNSTQPVTTGTPSTRYNCANVQNYFTFQDGVTATIKTMTNGYYPYIIKALKNNIKDYEEMKELATLVQLWDMTGKIPSKWL